MHWTSLWRTELEKVVLNCRFSFSYFLWVVSEMEMKRLCKKCNLWAADSVTTALRCASQNCGSELCHHSMSVRLMPSTRQSRDNRCSFFKALPSFPIVLSLPFPLFRQYQPVSASFSSSRASTSSIPTRTSQINSNQNQCFFRTSMLHWQEYRRFPWRCSPFFSMH
jgi:hypothetical protein